VFTKNGTITAGNSSGITDGASAVVLVSEAEVARRKLNRWHGWWITQLPGVDPKIMGIGPVPAVRSW